MSTGLVVQSASIFRMSHSSIAKIKNLQKAFQILLRKFRDQIFSFFTRPKQFLHSIFSIAYYLIVEVAFNADD